MSEEQEHRPAHLLSASELRARMAEHDAFEAAKQAAQRQAEAKRRKSFTDDFLSHHLGEKERGHILALVDRAALHDEFEVMVYSFPSYLCTDGGRAINNVLPNWPATLQGKARDIFELFERVGKPLGYRFRAMVINFPGGIPGDIGFFVSWKPPAI